MNLRLYQKGELVNESENSMTKGYSVLSLDQLEKGEYHVKADIDWNVASDVERSYNFRIYSPKAVKITDKRGN